MRTAENEMLCRVGSETPMGKLVRQFWVPGCLSSDVAKPSGAPIRVKLYGEDLVVFRGEDGRVGVLDEFCPHRGVSLALARNEDCALRCIFHGWKIARDGSVLDMPNAEDDRALKHYRARSYAVEESHGLIWIYLGDPKTAPPRPRYAWEKVAEENCLAIPVDLDCNWLQSLEGLVDTAHTGILHEDALRLLSADLNPDVSSIQTARAPKLEIERTDFGFHYAAIRQGDDVTRVRITAYIAPFLCLIPPTGQAFMAVPMTDELTRFYNIWWSKIEKLADGPGREKREMLWGLSDAILDSTGMRSHNPLTDEARTRNIFTQNRLAMEAGDSFGGLPGLTAEDAAVAVTMGPIAKRNNEHLLPADAAVVELRQILRDGALAARDGNRPVCLGGRTPAGEIDAVTGTLSPGENWRDMVRQHVLIA